MPGMKKEDSGGEGEFFGALEVALDRFKVFFPEDVIALWRGMVSTWRQARWR